MDQAPLLPGSTATGERDRLITAFARLALVEVSKAGPDMRETQIRVTERFREALHDPAMPYIPIEIQKPLIGGIHSLVANYVETGRTRELPELLPELTYF